MRLASNKQFLLILRRVKTSALMHDGAKLVDFRNKKYLTQRRKAAKPQSFF